MKRCQHNDCPGVLRAALQVLNMLWLAAVRTNTRHQVTLHGASAMGWQTRSRVEWHAVRRGVAWRGVVGQQDGNGEQNVNGTGSQGQALENGASRSVEGES